MDFTKLEELLTEFGVEKNSQQTEDIDALLAKAQLNGMIDMYWAIKKILVAAKETAKSVDIFYFTVLGDMAQICPGLERKQP